MSAEYVLRQIMSEEVKRICAEETVSWAAMEAMYRDVDPRYAEECAKRRAADALSHKIIGEVMQSGTWSSYRTLNGMAYRLEGVWLDREELFRLLQRAYDAGVRRQRTLTVGFNEAASM